VSRLTYAAPAWWGFITAADQQKLQALLNRAVKWGFYKPSAPPLEHIVSQIERKLFFNVLANPAHVLHQLLPPPRPALYNLRSRVHNRALPTKSSALVAKNFFYRLLYSTLK